MFKDTKHLFNSGALHIEKLVERASDTPVLGELIRAGKKGRKDQNKDMAASIAYFTFLSLFPMSLGLFALAGFILKSAEVEASLNNLLVQMLPVSSEFVKDNIDSLIRLRGTMGFASIIVLMWSARKMVSALSRGINNALGLNRNYALYLSPLRNFALTLTASLLIFVAIGLAPVINVLSELQLTWIGPRLNAAIDLVSGHVTGFVVTGILITGIYVLTPFERMSWKELLPGIFIATLIVEFGKKLFVIYFSNVSDYDAVYGSVSSIIVLLIWLYFWAAVLLYGSEIIAIYRESGSQNTTTEPEKSETGMVN